MKGKGAKAGTKLVGGTYSNLKPWVQQSPGGLEAILVFGCFIVAGCLCVGYQKVKVALKKSYSG